MAIVASALVELTSRPPAQVRAQLVAAGPIISPPPLDIVPATPIASEAPRVEAPRPANPRTAGQALSRPVAARGYVQIPAIGTNAQLVRVGINQFGDMDLPKSASLVAWLDNGSFPGPTRNAILGGHRNWNGASGALERLENAHGGDVVRVGLNDKVYTFGIVWIRTYGKDVAPDDDIMGPTGTDSLTLVTCGGKFNPKTGHYERLVVARAELVSVS